MDNIAETLRTDIPSESSAPAPYNPSAEQMVQDYTKLRDLAYEIGRSLVALENEALRMKLNRDAIVNAGILVYGIMMAANECASIATLLARIAEKEPTTQPVS